MLPRWSSRQIPRAICSVRTRAIFKPTMWYLPLDRAKRASFHRSVPMCRTTSVSCIRADTAIPANCRQALFSSWGAVHRVFKSPKTCITIAEKSTSAWGVIGGWGARTAGAPIDGRLARRYRGRDYAWWALVLGHYEHRRPDIMATSQNGPSIPPGPLLTGVNGGYEADFRELAAKEIVLLGRLKAIKGATLALAPDLEDNLAKGDEWLHNYKKAVDDYVAKNKLDVPEQGAPADSSPSLEGIASAPILELDLRVAGITSIIWATGFGNDYDWLKLPLLDERGEPLHERGVTQ